MTTGGKRQRFIEPLDSDRALPTKPKNQHTPPIDNLFAQSLGSFTLGTATTASTATVLQYVFFAAAGHTIAIGNEILLLDPVANKSFFAKVLNVVTNTITVDRPIDGVYPAPGDHRILTTEMAVDGSVTTQIFQLRGGAVPLEFTRFVIQMLDTRAMDDGLFAGNAALTRGLVFRIVNGFQKTVFCFKTNGDIKLFSHDFLYADKAPAGQNGANGRLTFNGKEKHGVAIEIVEAEFVQWLVQDDLRGLTSLKISGMGAQKGD